MIASPDLVTSSFFLPIHHSHNSVPHLTLCFKTLQLPFPVPSTHFAPCPAHGPNPNLRQVQLSQFSLHSLHSYVSTHSCLSHLGSFSSSCSVPPGSSCCIQAPSRSGSIPIFRLSLPKNSLSLQFLILSHVSFFPRLNYSWRELLLLELFCPFLLRYFPLQAGNPDPSKVFIRSTPVVTFTISPMVPCRRNCTSGYSCSQIHPLLLQK